MFRLSITAAALAVFATGLTAGTAQAITTWNFAGDGGVLGESHGFVGDDGTPIVANGFAALGEGPPDDVGAIGSFDLHQTADGIGVCEIEDVCAFGSLDALPDASFFSINLGTAAFEAVRLDVGGSGWTAKSITLSFFEGADRALILAGDEADGSDAVLLDELAGTATDPETFLLAGTERRHHFFVVAEAIDGSCPFIGLCGTATSFRVLEFQGQGVPAPGMAAILGFAVIGLHFARRRRAT